MDGAGLPAKYALGSFGMLDSLQGQARVQREKSRGLDATYNAGMDLFMKRTLDWFAALAGVAAVLGLVRQGQFGPIYIFMIVALCTLCVLPAFFLRADRHLALRGNLVVVGFMGAMFVGIANLGLNAVALIGIPLFLGVSAAISGRVLPYVGMVLAMAALCLIAYLFVTGGLGAPDPALGTWSMNPTNWVIAIVCNGMVSFLLITMIQNLRACWKETNEEAINGYRQLEALIETAPDAIVIYNMQTDRFVTVNAKAEQILCRERRHICENLTVDDLVSEHQPDALISKTPLRTNMERAVKGQTEAFEVTLCDANGKEVPCEATLSRLPSIGEELIRASFVDLTERKAALKRQTELQAQLEASQRLEAIGKLTGGIAHDFNNLLAVVLGNLELLKEANKCEHDEEFIDASIKATLRGAELTRSMLSFARKAPLRPKTINLNSVVSATRNWAGRTLPSNITIETQLAADLSNVKTDEAALESAVLNLVLNAQDALPDGGRLKISTMNFVSERTIKDDLGQELSPGSYVVVEVADTGCGMQPDVLERVFEPFFTTKGVSKGSGLGLPMVHGFMAQSGGIAQIFSELGHGTRVRLCFPAIEKPADLEREEYEAPSIKEQFNKRILVAEDEGDVAKVIDAILTNAGYATHVERTGDAAKTAFVADPTFDLLLTDIVMPGRLQGFELAEELRRINPSLPVVIMSGHSEPAGSEIAHKYGNFRLVKPMLGKDLIAAMSEALGMGNKPAERLNGRSTADVVEAQCVEQAAN